MPNDISQNPSRHSFRRVFEIEILTRLNIRKSYHIFSYTSLKKNTYYFFNDKYFQLIHPYPHIFSSHFQTAFPPQV